MGLVACEMMSRLFLDPGDYLSVRTVEDQILGIRVTPGSPGFDGWGFRNKTVPSSVDIVAIGDSHTYGNNATMADSWPYVVAQVTGLSVYNLGLGGYGPNQYFYLLRERALSLKPRWVLCAIYMGDDFENAFLMTYGKPYWSFLTQGEWAGVQANIWEAPSTKGGWDQSLRNWLSQNSVVYRLVVHGPILGPLKGTMQVNAAARERQSTTALLVPDVGIQEAFRPTGIRDRLDQRNAAVREGMRITFDLLKRMDEVSRDQGVRFGVMIIPTKETVFAEYLLKERTLHLRDVIEDVIVNEELATRELLTFLDLAGIPHVETLSALRSRLGQRLYTRSDRDMHPARNGYRVIGGAAATFITAKSSAGSIVRPEAEFRRPTVQ
jgi:hypothetical protein